MTQAVPVQHIYFLLDRSGSMESIRSDVIGGFNRFLEEQREAPGQCLITLVQFDTHRLNEVLVDACPIDEVEGLTKDTFVPRGGTPLYDAIGNLVMDAIVREEKRLHRKRTKELVTFVVFTDGLENSSRHYDRAKVFEMIEHRQARGWTFLYFGANQDAFAEGRKIGIDPSNVMPFTSDSRGVDRAFRLTSRAYYDYRNAVSQGYDATPTEFFQEYMEADEEGREKWRRNPDRSTS